MFESKDLLSIVIGKMAWLIPWPYPPQGQGKFQTWVQIVFPPQGMTLGVNEILQHPKGVCKVNFVVLDLF